MVELVIQYPWLLYLLIFLALLIFPLLVGMAVVGFIQGREVSIPIFRVGPHPSSNPPQVQSIELSMSGITDENIDDITERVRERLEKYKAEEGISEEAVPLDRDVLSDHSVDLYRMKVAIGKKVREIVLSWGGGWAGSSLASFETFYDLAGQHNLIPDEILQDIQAFEWLLRPGIYGDQIGAEQYQEISQLAAKILDQLDEIEVRQMGSA